VLRLTVRVPLRVDGAAEVDGPPAGDPALGTAVEPRPDLGTAICGKRATGSVSSGIGTSTAAGSTAARTALAARPAYGSASASIASTANHLR
jgi:hypothetical protein